MQLNIIHIQRDGESGGERERTSTKGDIDM